jgi:hypothetical protein
MPTLTDAVTGEEFRPILLVNTKNVTRGLAALIESMNVCMARYDSVTSFRRMQKPMSTGVLTLADEKKVGYVLLKAYVSMNNRKLEMEDSDTKRRTVMYSYGIMEVLQLRHAPLLKQHYPSTITTSIEVPPGRYRRGTPRLGERELLATMMQNMAVVRTDGCILNNCSICEPLPTYCPCPIPKPPTATCQSRYLLVELNVFATTVLNDSDKPVLTMRFKTRT